jgi:hypothetical protein
MDDGSDIWNCDDMERDWTSVPSSQTRHSTVESGSSVNNFFDMRTSSSVIASSPKVRHRHPSTRSMFDVLPRTELFFEIRSQFSSVLCTTRIIFALDTSWRPLKMFSCTNATTRSETSARDSLHRQLVTKRVVCT